MEDTRPASSGLESILAQPFEALDHGFVRVVDYMGNDDAIVQAARVSYGAGTKTVQDDRALIRYLMRHWHSTPFEMCEIKLHVKLPIFVARQWVRHRTANINEYSARYSVLAKEFYIPHPRAICLQSVTNNQGRGEPLRTADAEIAAEIMRGNSDKCYDVYSDLLGGPEEGKEGVARELARSVLPVSAYTEWYWKIDLHNLLSFLRLRADPHAQFEIRVYANIICDMVQKWVPHAWEAFEDYRAMSVNFSRLEIKMLSEMIHTLADEPRYTPIPELDGMSVGERAEFAKKLEILWRG